MEATNRDADNRTNEQIAVVGLISDTHGLLRDEAIRALEGSDLIIHAGDVGKPEIVETLERLAPVVAVRGNIDRDAWALALPQTAVVEAGQTTIYVLHNLDELDLNPQAAGIHVVISGHSHKPSQTDRSQVIYINPGSAGPRRFQLPVTVARLDLRDIPWRAEFIDLVANR